MNSILPILERMEKYSASVKEDTIQDRVEYHGMLRLSKIKDILEVKLHLQIIDNQSNYGLFFQFLAVKKC